MLVVVLVALAGCTSKNEESVNTEKSSLGNNNTLSLNSDSININENSCQKGDFANLSDNLYLTAVRGIYEVNPNRTPQDSFNEACENCGETLFLALNIDEKLSNNFDYEGGYKLKGRVFCSKGVVAGQNINNLYCQDFMIVKQPISVTGEIGEIIKYFIYVTFDAKNVTLTEVSGSSVPNEMYTGNSDYVHYKVEGAEVLSIECLTHSEELKKLFGG